MFNSAIVRLSDFCTFSFCNHGSVFVSTVDPNFYSMNLLMLGKTYLRLKNTKMALLYLTRARDYHVSTEDDKNVSIPCENIDCFSKILV